MMALAEVSTNDIHLLEEPRLGAVPLPSQPSVYYQFSLPWLTRSGRGLECISSPGLWNPILETLLEEDAARRPFFLAPLWMLCIQPLVAAMWLTFVF